MIYRQNDKLDWTIITKVNCCEKKLHLGVFVIFLSNLDYDNIECRINARQLSRINLAAILLSHSQIMKKLTLSLLKAAKKQFSSDRISDDWTTIITNFQNCGFIKYSMLTEVYSSRLTKISVTFEESHYLWFRNGKVIIYKKNEWNEVSSVFWYRLSSDFFEENWENKCFCTFRKYFWK